MTKPFNYIKTEFKILKPHSCLFLWSESPSAPLRTSSRPRWGSVQTRSFANRSAMSTRQPFPWAPSQPTLTSSSRWRCGVYPPRSGPRRWRWPRRPWTGHLSFSPRSSDTQRLVLVCQTGCIACAKSVLSGAKHPEKMKLWLIYFQTLSCFSYL